MDVCIKVDLKRFEDRIYAEFQQGERDSRTLYVEPRVNGEPCLLPSDIKAKIQYDKPDNKTINREAAIRDNRVVIPITEQMCTTEGICNCKISFYTDTQFQQDGTITQGITVLKTSLFKIRIKGGMIDEAHIVSSDEFSDLLAALQRVDKVINDFTILNEEYTVITEECIQATADLRSLESDVTRTEASRVTSETARGTTLGKMFPKPIPVFQKFVESLTVPIGQYTLVQHAVFSLYRGIEHLPFPVFGRRKRTVSFKTAAVFQKGKRN